MTNRRQQLGRRGEAIAARHLEANGHGILETNFRTRGGEIDIVARKDGVIVFVEVRTKSGSSFGSPEDSLTPVKRSRLVAVAEEYLQTTGDENAEWRIDLCALEMNSRGALLRLDVIENAVEI